MHAPKKQALKRKRSHETSTACQPVSTVEIGQVILCKLRGWCEWPGRVSQIVNDKIKVTFYGDYSITWTSIGHIFSFENSVDNIMMNLRTKKTPLYAKSICEAEVNLRIPPHLSLLKKVNDL